MEQYLSEQCGHPVFLLPCWDVHHINGVKTDNRIENLQILKHAEHTALSHKGVKDPPMSLERRQKKSELVKTWWQDPDYHTKMSAMSKIIWEREDYHEKMSIKHKNRWANPEFHAMMVAERTGKKRGKYRSRGQKRSEETKKNMRAAWVRRKAK